MDFLERLNRRFGGWYENLFSAGDASGERELRPRDILRRIVSEMEDARREGLDGGVYVPNIYILEVSVRSDDERDYLRAFLSADELCEAVRKTIAERGYKTRGSLLFEIKENEAASGESLKIRCRFDVSVTEKPTDSPDNLPQKPISNRDDDEPMTVPAPFAVLGSLIVRTPGKDTETYPLGGKGLQIGRSKVSGNDIVLNDDAQISKVHARIVYANGGFTITDLASTNGTYRNDQPLVSQQPTILKDGDILRVGQTTLLYRINNTPQQSSHANTIGANIPFHQFLMPSGERYAVASGVVLGSATGADILLSLPGVAERHARFIVKESIGQIEDLATANGTFVNGVRLRPHWAVALYNGDKVGLGDSVVLEYLRGNSENGSPY